MEQRSEPSSSTPTPRTAWRWRTWKSRRRRLRRSLVRVAAVSLNRGEVRRAESSEPGFRPGWDLGGYRRTCGRGRLGPAGGLAGRRLPALRRLGRACRRADGLPGRVCPRVCPSRRLRRCRSPASRPSTRWRRGATCSAGPSWLRAPRAGPDTSPCSSPARPGRGSSGSCAGRSMSSLVEEAGAHEVVVDESGAAAGEQGPYHLILESVGGEVLGNALSMLAPGGTCVSFRDIRLRPE